jgi:hypothetical protein
MLVHVTFYKSSGKYYTEGRVEIDANPWETEKVLTELVVNQDILVSSALCNGDVYAVIQDIPESHNDPNYRMTYNRLIKRSDFLRWSSKT